MLTGLFIHSFIWKYLYWVLAVLGKVLFFLIFIGVLLLYNVVLVCAIQQIGSAVCLLIPPVLGISFPFRLPQRWVVFPVLYSRFSIVIPPEHIADTNGNHFPHDFSHYYRVYLPLKSILRYKKSQLVSGCYTPGTLNCSIWASSESYLLLETLFQHILNNVCSLFLALPFDGSAVTHHTSLKCEYPYLTHLPPFQYFYPSGVWTQIRAA